MKNGGKNKSVAFIILFSVYLAFYIDVKADTNLCAQKHKNNNLFINPILTQSFYKLLP